MSSHAVECSNQPVNALTTVLEVKTILSLFLFYSWKTLKGLSFLVRQSIFESQKKKKNPVPPF